jgi:two-component system phosphate regulon response regulator PhoB
MIVGLRKKLGAAGSCIETVRGVGYRFREDQ